MLRSASLALTLAIGGIALTAFQTDHPAPLAIGAAAPDFKPARYRRQDLHRSASFKSSKALVVIFTAVHCPTAEVYEARIKQLVDDYRKKGVAFAVIQPNNAQAVRLDEMGYTDLGDSIEDMKTRADHRKFNFPFLYDGEKQEVSNLYGPVATPHVFVFDAERKLRYQGRVDSNPREAYAKVPDARNALDAVLGGTPVPVEKTPAVGCSIKWLDKVKLHNAEAAAFAKEPVPLEKIDSAGIKALRENASDKTLLVNFWATWCGPCEAEFPDLLNTWRMYRKRPFELVTISVNYPDEEKAVRTFLESTAPRRATTCRHRWIRTRSSRSWIRRGKAACRYSVVIAPGGKVISRTSGQVNILNVRRQILASFPDDDYVGQNAYWNGK